MKWTDIPWQPTHKVLRQFATAWLAFFGAVGLYQYVARGPTPWALGLMVAAVAVGATGLVWPTAVRWLFVAWMVVAFPIGWLVSQAMLVLMYYGLITPVAFWFRLRGRDLLGRKRAAQRTSYWLMKETPQDVRRYFRQY